MFYSLNKAISLALFIVAFFSAIRAESLTLHDAAFSPDGETIGVGTDTGFQLLDKEGKQVLFSYPVLEGVQLLKWAPGSKRVLLVSWKEQEVPIYSLLDIGQNRILFSFPERVRWYYYYSNKASGLVIDEKIYPRSPELGHPAAMAFSPDGKELAYITEAGSIRVRNTETGDLLREFPLSDYHATSLGYAPDGNRMWVGIIIESPQSTDPTRLLYLNSQSGEVLEKKKLFYDIYLVKGSELFWVYDVRPDQKYALAVSSLYYVGTTDVPTLHNYIVDLNIEKPIASISIAASSLYAIVVEARSVFSTSGTVYGVAEVDDTWESRIYDYSQLKIVDGWNSLGHFPFPVPVHPFSPDGQHFLMIQDDKLHIIETETLSRETMKTVTLSPACVQRHEWMLWEPEGRD